MPKKKLFDKSAKKLVGQATLTGAKRARPSGEAEAVAGGAPAGPSVAVAMKVEDATPMELEETETGRAPHAEELPGSRSDEPAVSADIDLEAELASLGDDMASGIAALSQCSNTQQVEDSDLDATPLGNGQQVVSE